MTNDKEHPFILLYTLVFFLLLTLVSYLLLKQYLESKDVPNSPSDSQLISPSIDINNLFK